MLGAAGAGLLPGGGSRGPLRQHGSDRLTSQHQQHPDRYQEASLQTQAQDLSITCVFSSQIRSWRTRKGLTELGGRVIMEMIVLINILTFVDDLVSKETDFLQKLKRFFWTLYLVITARHAFCNVALLYLKCDGISHNYGGKHQNKQF